MKKSELLPRSKHDLESVKALVAAGPEAALPILDELLTWVQDINWPVAHPVAMFLLTVGAPLIPPLRKVLRSGDEMWIYWVLGNIVANLPKNLIAELEPELNSLAYWDENASIAFRIAIDAGVWPAEKSATMIARKIAAYEGFITELKDMQADLKP